MRALVIITLQNDFCSFGNLAVDSADLVAEKANRLMPFFDKVIAVNFAFPPNHLSFAANHLFRQPGKSMQINGREQLLKSMHCVDGSYGAEFPSALFSQKIDFLQKVGTNAKVDVYTMFRDADKSENNLLAFLTESQINELFFIGIGADFFVNSIKDAETAGYSIKIIGDACAGPLDIADASIIPSSAIIS
jgi:nicotinamidase/pyrazinamidase